MVSAHRDCLLSRFGVLSWNAPAIGSACRRLCLVCQQLGYILNPDVVHLRIVVFHFVLRCSGSPVASNSTTLPIGCQNKKTQTCISGSLPAAPSNAINGYVYIDSSCGGSKLYGWDSNNCEMAAAELSAVSSHWQAASGTESWCNHTHCPFKLTHSSSSADKPGACTTIAGYSGASLIKCSGTSAIFESYNSVTCSGVPAVSSVVATNVGVCGVSGPSSGLFPGVTFSNTTTCTTSSATTAVTAAVSILLVAVFSIASAYSS